MTRQCELFLAFRNFAIKTDYPAEPWLVKSPRVIRYCLYLLVQRVLAYIQKSGMQKKMKLDKIKEIFETLFCSIYSIGTVLLDFDEPHIELKIHSIFRNSRKLVESRK